MGRTASTSKASPSREEERKMERSLKEVQRSMHKVSDRRVETEASVMTVRKLHERTSDVLVETQLTSQLKSKIRASYRSALADAQDDAQRLHHCVDAIQKRRAERAESKASSDHKPMRRGDLMVMLQSYECPPGDACAALVRNSEAESSDDEFNWILGEVSETTAAGKYRVDDVDEEMPETHLLGKARVVALPHYRACTRTDPSAIFPVDAKVLALYPQTTCFYKGVIERRPLEATDDYLVAFADKAFVTGYSPPLPVPQRYLVKFTSGGK